MNNISVNNLNKLSQCVKIYKEKVSGNGEDSVLMANTDYASIIGTFDGVGGSGAKRYKKADFKTGAYISSRNLSNRLLNDIFKRNYTNPSVFARENTVHELEKYIQSTLTVLSEKFSEVTTSRLKSKFSKEFPTTAVFAVCYPNFKNEIETDVFWAGDSRCYLLNEDGLHQITVDDSNIKSALDNISEDGKMTNVISLNDKVKLNHHHLNIRGPFFIFTCTDGCYGYIKSPMEFEFTILESLFQCISIDNFTEILDDRFNNVSQDDYSLSGLFYNFDSYESLKIFFEKRYIEIKKIVESITNESDIKKIWNESYKDTYTKYSQ